jgi:hypothetical protein
VDEAKRAERLAERQRRMAARQLEREQQEQEQERKRDQAIAQFWASLTNEERTRLETEALAQAPALQHKLLLGSGTLAATTRKSVLDAYALKLMQHG